MDAPGGASVERGVARRRADSACDRVGHMQPANAALGAIMGETFTVAGIIWWL